MCTCVHMYVCTWVHVWYVCVYMYVSTCMAFMCTCVCTCMYDVYVWEYVYGVYVYMRVHVWRLYMCVSTCMVRLCTCVCEYVHGVYVYICESTCVVCMCTCVWVHAWCLCVCEYMEGWEGVDPNAWVILTDKRVAKPRTQDGSAAMGAHNPVLMLFLVINDINILNNSCGLPLGWEEGTEQVLKGTQRWGPHLWEFSRSAVTKFHKPGSWNSRSASSHRPPD